MQQGAVFGDAIARIAPRIERIIASPLHRTRATAQFAADRLNVPLETDDALLEIEHGTWNGRMRDEIAANDPERYRLWRERPQDVSFEGGETLRDVMMRWQRFRAALHVDVPTLLVTHDAVVRVALLDITGRPLSDFWAMRAENAAYAHVHVDGSAWTLRDESVSDHLAGMRASIEGQAL